MHKRDMGKCVIHLQLVAQSDILVGARETEIRTKDNKQTTVSAFFQGIDPASQKPNCLIPATSLKGVLRSTSERILRSYHPSLACDPFTTEGQQATASKEAGLHLACSKKFENRSQNGDSLYKLLCPACRLFGATVHKGILTVEDAILDHGSSMDTDDSHQLGDPLPEEERRTRIGIDRWTGGIRSTKGGGATQRVLVLPPGSRFTTTLQLQNFSLWQLGLVATCLNAMSAGWSRIGAGTRKGMGHVRAKVTKIKFCYPTVRYWQALSQRPDDQEGVLCAPQHLMDLTFEPDIAEEQAWFGISVPGTEGQNWHDQSWITFQIPPKEHTDITNEENSIGGETANTEASVTIPDVLQHIIEQSLAPRLKAKRHGFFSEEA